MASLDHAHTPPCNFFGFNPSGSACNRIIGHLFAIQCFDVHQECAWRDHYTQTMREQALQKQSEVIQSLRQRLQFSNKQGNTVKRLLGLFLICLIGLGTVSPNVFGQSDTGVIQFSQAELDQLLAPIALYPDPLLGQVLSAATYPLEVVQAARFVQQNPSLKGDVLAQVVTDQPWDASVKALVQFPAVLIMMNDQLAWTEKLGDAFLAQQDAVMDTAQALRTKALAAGTLRSNQQQQVVTRDGEIVIEPVGGVVYQPYYNPVVVYGNWWWPERPPFFWNPPPLYQPPYYGDLIGAGIVFGIGAGIVGSLFFDIHPDWHGHRFIAHHGHGAPGVVWSHDPRHRLGVTYRDAATRNRLQPFPHNDGGRDAYRGHVPGGTGRPAGHPSGPRPLEPVHPFIPGGPAGVTRSHADRGRASREASDTRPAVPPRQAPRQHRPERQQQPQQQRPQQQRPQQQQPQQQQPQQQQPQQQQPQQHQRPR
jgi:hypothetical protein